MPTVRMKNVSYAYPGNPPAIDGISLELGKGEVVAIIGQNGAGKTTTVKMINGLLKPDEGQVLIGDRDTKDYTTAQISRNVGYVFQNPDDQIFHSSVYDEVAYGVKKTDREEDRKKKLITYALNWTGLSGLREENPYNLPLSVRKFVTIASIIAMDVDIMIFDEPTAGQDLSGTRRLGRILTELRRRGKTVVTITHDMQFVVENFEKIIVMADRNIVTIGSPREIFWDFEVLEKAMLKQPFISSLCRELGLGEGIVNSREAIDALCERMAGATENPFAQDSS